MIQSEGADTAHRGGSSPAAPAPPLEDEDLLREILLLLPPLPSSLLRASAVCKHWRGLVTDPKFLLRFRAHHRKPPLIGVFVQRDMVFRSILDPPDRIPPERFDLQRQTGCTRASTRGCSSTYLPASRHGRALLMDEVRNELIVCDPVTGGQHRMAPPPAFNEDEFSGAVLCSATDHDHDHDHDHVHGSCSSSPFKVVLVSRCGEYNRTTACVYSSETGAWDNLISTSAPHCADGHYGILVGNAVYFLLYDMDDGILEVDLGEESLAVIKGPPVTNDFCHGSPHIIQGEDGALGLAILYCSRIQMWQRSSNCHGVATWVLWKTIEIHNILGPPPQIESRRRRVEIIVGYLEDDNVLFIHVDANVYMVYLKSMQSRKLYEAWAVSACHPFTSFYAPGTTIAGGSDEGEGMAAEVLTELVALHQYDRQCFYVI